MLNHKHYLPLFIVLFSCLSFAAKEAWSQNGLRNVRICIDNNKNRVVLKRRCRAPRFEEVFPSSLTSSSSLQLEVYSESFPTTLSSTGDVRGRSIFCPDGKLITGGGASVIDNDGLLPKTSIPRSDLSGWSASVQALKNNASGTVNIYAICGTGIENAQ